MAIRLFRKTKKEPSSRTGRWASVRSGLKRYFLAGILIIVPIGITFFIISWVITFTDSILDFIPSPYHPRTYIPIPGWGFIFTFLIILFSGMLATNIFGKKLLTFWNDLINRIPLIRTIYGATRQLLESFFMQTGKHFQRVVLIEYPRKGIWSIAFLTGDTREMIQKKAGKKMVSVFLPSTPNPTTGFFIMLPEEDVKELPISVEDAAKLIISAGMIAEKSANPPRYPQD